MDSKPGYLLAVNQQPQPSHPIIITLAQSILCMSKSHGEFGLLTCLLFLLPSAALLAHFLAKMLALKHGLYLHCPSLIYGRNNIPTKMTLCWTVKLLPLLGVLCGGAGVPEGFPWGSTAVTTQIYHSRSNQGDEWDIVQPEQPEQGHTISSLPAVHYYASHVIVVSLGFHVCLHLGTNRLIVLYTLTRDDIWKNDKQRVVYFVYFFICLLLFVVLSFCFSLLLQWPGASVLHDNIAWDGWNWWVRKLDQQDLPTLKHIKGFIWSNIVISKHWQIQSVMFNHL